MAHQGPTFHAYRLEHPYGVGLMDDLHNFFPEVMYDNGLFSSPLVGFLQRRVETLFEEDYTRNRTQYRMFQQTRRRRESGILMPSSHLVGTAIPATGANTGATIGMTVRQPVPTHQINPWPQTLDEVPADIQSLFATLGIQGFNTLFTQLSGTLVSTEEQSEIPTADQIVAASLLTSLEPPADVECSVCQEHVAPNNQIEWRILRHCNHQFHRSCIDTWFQRNAHCPVCRHDIRISDQPENPQSS